MLNDYLRLSDGSTVLQDEIDGLRQTNLPAVSRQYFVPFRRAAGGVREMRTPPNKSMLQIVPYEMAAGGCSPLSTARALSAASMAMAVRVSTVAEPRCGSSATLSNSRRPGWTRGSCS